MKNLKRDNWTNDEVIKIIKGCKLVRNKNKGEEESKLVKDHNFGIDSALSNFYSFQADPKEFGALAYCPEEDMIYHIGDIPE